MKSSLLKMFTVVLIALSIAVRVVAQESLESSSESKAAEIATSNDVLQDISLPFIDLHRNLEGALTLNIIKKLAKTQKIKLPANSDEQLKETLYVSGGKSESNIQKGTDSDKTEYLNTPLDLLQTKKGITQGVNLVCNEAEEEGLLYMELYITPQLHCKAGLNQESVIKAALKGVKKSPLHTNIVLCCPKGDDVLEKNMETITLAKKYLVKDGGVVALALESDSDTSIDGNFNKELEAAKSLSVPFALYTGFDAISADCIKMAIDYGVARLGYSDNLPNNEELLGSENNNPIAIDITPTYNKAIKIVEDMAQYTIKKYLDAGVAVTINTANTAICHTTLKNEWDVIKKLHNLTYDDVEKLFFNAANSAFTDDKTKLALKATIESLKAAVEKTIKGQ